MDREEMKRLLVQQLQLLEKKSLNGGTADDLAILTRTMIDTMNYLLGFEPFSLSV